jgi:hypothetical protein
MKINVEKIKDSYIAYYSEPSIHVKDYYEYCTTLLKQKLYLIENSINIIFGKFDLNFNNINKTLKTDIQIEHTLVKDGGRGVKQKIFGTIPDNNNFYLVRIDNYEYFNSLDFVIEYSIPNICNIKSCDMFNDYVKKNINISPLCYDVSFDNINKKDTITLFSNNGSDRREQFLRQISSNLQHIHINNCFLKKDILSQYDKTKILINLRQTDHHDTFEEIRVLPALRRGVIIVSEDIPLKEKLPYHEHVIWCHYKDLITTTKQIEQNYSYYYNKIFNDKLKNIFKNMEKNNYDNLSLLEKLI